MIPGSDFGSMYIFDVAPVLAAECDKHRGVLDPTAVAYQLETISVDFS